MITELCQKDLYRLSDETSKIECYFFTATGFPLKLGCKLVKFNMISVAVTHVIIFWLVNSSASCALHFLGRMLYTQTRHEYSILLSKLMHCNDGMTTNC